MTNHSRLKSLDTLRGVLMLLMLLEHARQMLSGVVILETRHHPGHAGLETVPLLIRSLSHLCAPGFFFLLGVGMVLRMRQATSERHTWNCFFRRGFFLVLLQFFAENGAWALPLLLRADHGGEQGVLLYFGVLFGLGGSMILTALLWRFKDPWLFVIALAGVASSAWEMPGNLSPWIGWLVGGFSGKTVEILYPLLPWTGITLLGVLFARRGISDNHLRCSWLFKIIVALMVSLAVLTIIVPEGSPAVAAFYKYPPSLSYVLGMLLALLCLLYALSGCERLNFAWLQLLGRHALFFYLAHLYLLGFASLIFYHSSMTCIMIVALGVGAVTMLACWWLEASKGLGLFNRFSPWYDRFMQRWGLYHVEALRQALNPQVSGQSLLDVGGGTGYLASCLSDRFERVVVADLSPGMLSVARTRNLETVEASALELPFKDEEFDVVLCTDALHHIKQIERAVAEMGRVLKPGGTIVIHEFHVQGWKGFFFYWFERLFVDDSVFVTPAELQALLEKKGFATTCTKLSSMCFMVVAKKRP